MPKPTAKKTLAPKKREDDSPKVKAVKKKSSKPQNETLETSSDEDYPKQKAKLSKKKASKQNGKKMAVEDDMSSDEDTSKQNGKKPAQKKTSKSTNYLQDLSSDEETVEDSPKQKAKPSKKKASKQNGKKIAVDSDETAYDVNSEVDSPKPNKITSLKNASPQSESESESDSDTETKKKSAQKVQPSKKKAAKKAGKSDSENESDSDSDSKPVPKVQTKTAQKKAQKKKQVSSDTESEADSDTSPKKQAKKKTQKNKAATKKKSKSVDSSSEEESSEDEPVVRKGGKKKTAKSTKKIRKKKKKEDDEDIRDWPPYVRLKEGPGRKRVIRDIKVDDLTLTVPGQILIKQASLTLVENSSYGVIGRNGIGKSVLLRALAHREDPFDKVPDYVRILYVEQEIEGDDKTPLESVLIADIEREWLLAQEKILLEEEKEEERAQKERDDKAKERQRRQDERKTRKKEEGEEDEDEDEEDEEEEEEEDDYDYENEKPKRSYDLRDIYDRLREIEAAKAEPKAATILAGLGFTVEEIRKKKTKEYSGGWRMRIALARALFVLPDLLILDEPTNHLDLNAVIWLENYLSNWKRTLLVVSHERTFLGATVNNIIHFHNQTLTQYKGDYYAFLKARGMNQRSLEKRKDAQTRQTQKAQKFINENRGKAGGGAAKSKAKALKKNEVIELDTDDPSLVFSFPDPEPLGFPVLQLQDVSFGYATDKFIFRNLDFSIDLESRVAVVGPNGVGKSTLLKLLSGQLKETTGYTYRHRNLRIARFSQHHVDQLVMHQTPLEYMRSLFGEAQIQDIRKHLGRFGITDKLPLHSINTLSGGQKSRVALAELAWKKPHILLLDEPTNHLDMEMIESLGKALHEFKGGILLISHNQRLIELVCNDLWVCYRNGTVKRFDGEFEGYKKMVIEDIERTMKNFI